MSSSALLAALFLLPAPLRAAGEVAAVLSAGSGAYLEAFSAFQAAHGAEVPYFEAAKGPPTLPPGTRTVVAFGTKAAMLAYPADLNLVYAMAPGTHIPPEARSGRTVKINMSAPPELVISRVKQLQPSLKRLYAFWTLPSLGYLAEDLKKAGAAAGIEVSPVKVPDADSLPGLLRQGLRDMDAFWLPPDPFLITPETLMIFREFSWGNAVPMYASSKGITREGACASVGVSFAESGASAAAAVADLAAGRQPQAHVFPTRSELTINASAARRCGLRLSPELLREAAQLFP